MALQTKKVGNHWCNQTINSLSGALGQYKCLRVESVSLYIPYSWIDFSEITNHKFLDFGFRL